ncbi:MAG: glycosyltransferase family 2 protein [Parasporobacterium sp.]|nr:glycosyltransferase family 2 protein [Parasporobacterium sp.]
MEPYLHRCIDSILSQTFSDLELILVDDGSPDRCGEICDEYAKKDNRVHVIHQENGGLSAARNAGLDWTFANSDSQWMSFIDSDDWVHPYFLEYLYKAVQECEVDISACELIRVEQYQSFHEEVFNVETMEWEQFYISGWAKGAVACNKLYRKELFERLRYPVGKINEDEFVTYLLLEKAHRLAVLDSALYYYYQNPQGIMKSGFSRKKLDGLIALNMQCMFARKHGYRDFYLSRMKARFLRILEYKRECEKSLNLDVSEKRIIEQFLRTDLRKVLRLEGKTLAPFKEYIYCYEWAFPKLCQAYWISMGVKRKLKRIFKK